MTPEEAREESHRYDCIEWLLTQPMDQYVFWELRQKLLAAQDCDGCVEDAVFTEKEWRLLKLKVKRF